MPFVYKYVNRNTDDVEYVGISRDKERLYKRFADHSRDPWYEPFKYDIYYSEVASQTDAEALEGHFIAHYGSDKFYNKAKAKWGECSFAPYVEWSKYDPDSRIFNRTGLEKRLRALWGRMNSLEYEMERRTRLFNSMRMEVKDLELDIKKARRTTVRAWFNDVLSVSYDYNETKYKASKSFLYEIYENWAEEHEADWDFDDEDDLWDAMHDTPELARHIQGNEMFGLITKERAEVLQRQAGENIANVLTRWTKKEKQ